MLAGIRDTMNKGTAINIFTKYKEVIGWGLANKALSMLIGFISVSLINRLFGKELYGEMVFFQSVFAYLLILATLGFDKTILYKLSHYNETKSGLAGKSLVNYFQRYSFALLAVIEFLFIGVWYLFINKDFVNEWFWILLFSLNAFLSVTSGLYSSYFKANKYADTTVKINVVNSIIKLFILFVLYTLDFDSLLYFVFYIILPTTTSLLQFVWLDHRIKDDSSNINKPSKEELSYSIKMMLTKLVYQGVQKIDIVMIGILLSATFVAEYAVASKLSLLARFGFTLISPLFGSRFKYSIESKNCDKMFKEYYYSRFFSVAIGFIFLLFFLLCGEQILSIFGDYKQSYSLLILLSLAFLNHTFFAFSGSFLIFKGYASFTLISMIIALFSILVSNYFLIPRFGPIGAACGTFSSLLLLNIILEIYIYKKENIRFNSFINYLGILIFNVLIIGIFV